MPTNPYFLAKIGADTAENSNILPRSVRAGAGCFLRPGLRCSGRRADAGRPERSVRPVRSAGVGVELGRELKK